ncbi:hypothetical protein HK405_011458, partial [Cladochytrium tenue]
MAAVPSQQSFGGALPPPLSFLPPHPPRPPLPVSAPPPATSSTLLPKPPTSQPIQGGLATPPPPAPPPRHRSHSRPASAAPSPLLPPSSAIGVVVLRHSFDRPGLLRPLGKLLADFPSADAVRRELVDNLAARGRASVLAFPADPGELSPPHASSTQSAVAVGTSAENQSMVMLRPPPPAAPLPPTIFAPPSSPALVGPSWADRLGSSPRLDAVAVGDGTTSSGQDWSLPPPAIRSTAWEQPPVPRSSTWEQPPMASPPPPSTTTEPRASTPAMLAAATAAVETGAPSILPHQPPTLPPQALIPMGTARTVTFAASVAVPAPLTPPVWSQFPSRPLALAPDDPAAYEDTPVDPTFFLHTVLSACAAGLSSVPMLNPAIAEALVACQLGIDCIRVLDGGMASALATPWVPSTRQWQAQAGAVPPHTNGHAAATVSPRQPPTMTMPPSPSGTKRGPPDDADDLSKGKTAKAPKRRQSKKGKAAAADTPVAVDSKALARPRRLAATVPPEILLRIFGVLSEAAEQSLELSSASVLYACTLVCKSWNRAASAELWKRISMEDDAPRLGRLVISLSLSNVMGHKYGLFIRVVSVACTDAELSLLTTAAPFLGSLDSLELRRSTIKAASSYRLLAQLPGKLPSVRSLIADLIPASALLDVVQLAWSFTRLGHLHVTMGPADSRPVPVGIPGHERGQTPLILSPTALTDGTGLPFAAGTAAPGASRSSSPAVARVAPTPVSALPTGVSPITFLFARHSGLTTLSLWRVSLPRDEGLWVPALSRACPQLAAIRVDDCGPDLSMDLFVGLWRRCGQLESVVMRRVKRRAAFTELVERRRLRRVVLDGCWFNDALCDEVGRCAPGLVNFYVEDDWLDEDFRIAGAPTVVSDLTDRGVLSLGSHLRELRTVAFLG